MGLVGKVAKSYLGKTEYPYEDLYQQGCLGLVKAAKNFDKTKGIQFSSYAVPMIQGHIRLMLRDCRPLRINRETQKASYNVNKIVEALKKEFDRDPAMTEIAEAMNCSEADVFNAMNAYMHPLSFETKITNTKNVKIGESIVDETNLEEEVLENYQHRQLILHIMLLPKKFQQTMFLRLQGLSQTEIAEVTGRTQVCVSRWLKKAIETLKETMEFDIRENEIERVSVQ